MRCPAQRTIPRARPGSDAPCRPCGAPGPVGSARQSHRRVEVRTRPPGIHRRNRGSRAAPVQADGSEPAHRSGSGSLLICRSVEHRQSRRDRPTPIDPASGRHGAVRRDGRPTRVARGAPRTPEIPCPAHARPVGERRWLADDDVARSGMGIERPCSHTDGLIRRRPTTQQQVQRRRLEQGWKPHPVRRRPVAGQAVHGDVQHRGCALRPPTSDLAGRAGKAFGRHCLRRDPIGGRGAGAWLDRFPRRRPQR